MKKFILIILIISPILSCSALPPYKEKSIQHLDNNELAYIYMSPEEDGYFPRRFTTIQEIDGEFIGSKVIWGATNVSAYLSEGVHYISIHRRDNMYSSTQDYWLKAKKGNKYIIKSYGTVVRFIDTETGTHVGGYKGSEPK